MDADFIDRTLISQVALMNCSDNEIQMNQKVRNILFILQTTCITSQQLREVFNQLNARALEDAGFAVKAARFVSSSIFAASYIHGDLLRNLMLSGIRQNLQNAANWKILDKKKFYNSLNLLGEFYHKARLLDGSPFEYLGPYIIYYLNCLIEMRSSRAARELLIQLVQNGQLLIASHLPLMTDLMINIRKALTNNTHPGGFKILLLIAVDLQNTNFNQISGTLKYFYETIIGEVERKPQSYKETLV